MSIYTRDLAGNLVKLEIGAGGTGIDLTPVTNIPGSTGADPRQTQDYISQAMRQIGALALGEVAEQVELLEGMGLMNDMLDSWNTERYVIYTTQPYTFPLTPGKQTYTLGEGGDFNIPRPPKVERGVLRVTTVPNAPFEIGLRGYTDQEWAAIRLKSIGNTYAQGFWDDGAFPLRSLSFWPVPAADESVVLYVWYALAMSSDLTDIITLPPGYARALRFNLAVELLPLFPNPNVDPRVLQIAADSKQKIRSLNSANSVPIMACDPALTNQGTAYGYYQFLKGE